MTVRLPMVVWGAVAFLVSCSGTGSGAGASSPSVDEALPLPGVPDLGADPAVLAIERGGSLACAGTLILPDVVLTTRSCLSPGMPCPPSSLLNEAIGGAELQVHTIGEAEFCRNGRAGRETILPLDASGCEEDVAALVLERPVTGVQPIHVRARAVALGDHVRTVDFGLRDVDGQPVRRVRDHVRVMAAAAQTFALDDVSCESGCGGPAVDEMTGELVGVVSGGTSAPPCTSLLVCPASVSSNQTQDAFGEQDVVSRVDAFSPLLARAAAASTVSSVARGTRLRTQKGAVDLGAYCAVGADCAAGVCVGGADRRFCSRRCDGRDRCPARFRCARSPSSQAEESGVCVEL